MGGVFSSPSPSQILGVGSFDHWYPGQESVFQQGLSWLASPARFVGMALATGSGKTLSALLLSKMADTRTVILTATKGLQSQYDRDSHLLGGVVVVGQNNFPCSLVSGIMADEGPCHDGLPCSLREQCPYRVQLRRALNARLIVTNYAYWLAQTNFSSGLGEVGLLVCDEAHSCFKSLENYLTIFLSRSDLQPMGLNFPESADQWNVWRSWAAVCSPIAAANLASIEQDVKDRRQEGEVVPTHVLRAYRAARGLVARLERLSTVGETWVIERTHHGFRFVPKWVANYSSHLFHEVPKVALMSAILSHRSCDYLGVPDGDNRAWVEMDSYFPPQNTPIWHIPTARINFRTDDYGSTVWCMRIDQIIQRRLDRKGIIFTVSYDRARLLLSRSRFKDIMLTHSTGDVIQVVERFKKMPAPAILVSPSVTTGWDFPSVETGVRYLIVGKIPFPDSQDPVTKARYDEDKEWSAYLAMETFVQECGRASRSPEDRVECLVVDDMFTWWYPKYKNFAPRWFRARVRGSLGTVPDPLV